MTEKRATSFDVAKAAGTSRTTVSLVLNDIPGINISEATRRKVHEAADRLNYHPNVQGRKLSSGRSRVIGLVMLQSSEQMLNDAFLLQVLVGIDQVASQNGYHVLLKPIRESNLAEYTYLINESHVDGIIFSGPLQHDPDLVEIYQKGFPVVLMGQMAKPEIPFVDVNAELGAEMAVNHLVKLGHRRIGMITNAHLRYPSARQRMNGFLRGLEKGGLPKYDLLIKEGNLTPSSGFTAMQEILHAPERPTAVFVASDMVAIGATQAIRQSGLHIPKDISIIGFDDIPQAQYLEPPLTTIRLPARGLGWVAGEHLIRLIQRDTLEQTGVLLDTELINRSSTAGFIKDNFPGKRR